MELSSSVCYYLSATRFGFALVGVCHPHLSLSLSLSLCLSFFLLFCVRFFLVASVGKTFKLSALSIYKSTPHSSLFVFVRVLFFFSFLPFS